MRRYLIFTLIVLVQMVIVVFITQNNALTIERPVIAVKFILNKRLYKAGESINVTYEISNISESKVRLPPLQLVDREFTLYNGNTEILPFERPSMGFYVPMEQGITVLMPGQSRTFKCTIGTNAYSMPFKSGAYRLCIRYENHISTFENLGLWVGETSSCVPFEIR